MTTLLYSKATHTFYADGRETDPCGYIYSDTVDRFIHFPDGCVAAFAGSVQAIQEVEDHYPDFNSAAEAITTLEELACEGVLYDPRHDKVWHVSIGEGEVYMTPVSYDLAIGSGWQYATGALRTGCSPETAMRIAHECDVSTGPLAKSVRLLPASNEPPKDYVEGDDTEEYY